MPRGKRGPRPAGKDEKPNGKAPAVTEYKCGEKGCIFSTKSYDEMMEHLNGTGHTSFEQDLVSPELFSEPQPIIRKLRAKLADDEVSELNKQAAAIAIQLVEQREIATLAKERGKALEADQTAIVAKLRDPYKLADVQCEWKINFDENSKALVRKDTGETIETKALSEEDRAAELARVAAQNQKEKEWISNLEQPQAEVGAQ